MSHIFFKTRLCLKFSQGDCKHGDTCSFAHGLADLRHPPPNWQQLVREKELATGRWIDHDQRIPSTTKICKKFYNGEECPYGERCNFLHQRPSMPGFIGENKIGNAERMYSKPMFGERNHFDHVHTGLHPSRNHDEVGSMVNSRLVQAKPSPAATGGDQFPVAISNDPIDRESNDKKWKLNQKINSIYADWIDDITEY